MSANALKEQFEALLEESFNDSTPKEGSVVTGKIIGIEAGHAVVDIGYKMEGRIDLKEFTGPGDLEEIVVGDEVEVFLDRVEDARSEAVISRDKARREEAWDRLEKAYAAETKVEGSIFNRVKGGFTVDLGGAIAFLPGSQVDVRPVRDAAPLMGLKQPFQILKLNRRLNNIVVSRRAILEENRAEQRAEIINRLTEGDEIEGIIKNVTDYGAFVDLGGVDGLLHVTDMAWRRVNHPTEIVSIGETITVKIVKIKRETQRISLGIKQLQQDPWTTVESRFPIGSKHTGTVTNLTEYGAFVELDQGVEGLVHKSEMSWTKKNVDAGKIVSTSQKVEVMVLGIDLSKRRVSLGIKQCMENPWVQFAANQKVGDRLTGEIKTVAEFGIFVGLENDIDGMIHLSELTWDRAGDQALKEFRKGDMVEAVVTEIDVDHERVALSIKDLSGDPFTVATAGLKRGAVISVRVSAIEDNGVEVTYNGIKSFIRRADLSSERSQQRPDRFNVGDIVDVKVSAIDSKTRRLGVSVKSREISEAKEAVEQYGSSDAGASLGDILGAALRSKDEET